MSYAVWLGAARGKRKTLAAFSGASALQAPKTGQFGCRYLYCSRARSNSCWRALGVSGTTDFVSASPQLECSRRMRPALFALLAAVGCAQGYPSAPAQMIDPPSEPEPPVFTGEACEFGDRVPCECAGGRGMGVRACVPSDISPTKGMLSECVACSETSAGSSARTGSMSSAQTGTSTQAGRSTDAGGRSGSSAAGTSSAVQGAAAGKSSVSGGSGGKGGSSSSGAGNAIAGSSGKSGQGGGGGGGKSGQGGASSGTGGSSGRGGSSAAAGSGGRSERCECRTGCLLIGVFPCCRDNGSCGCTWAPGAYCM